MAFAAAAWILVMQIMIVFPEAHLLAILKMTVKVHASNVP